MKGPACLTPKYLAVERRLRRLLKRVSLVVYMRDDLRSDEGRFGCTFAGLDTASRRWVLNIHLEASMTEQEAIDTIIHEAGHALAWKKEKKLHDDAWALAHGRCYRAVEEASKGKSRRKNGHGKNDGGCGRAAHRGD